MNSTLISLLPFIIGSALVPVQIIVVVLLLTGEGKGLLKAIAFVTGMTLARLVQGLLFGFVFTGGSYDPADATNSAWIKATLLTVLGLMLLIAAYRKWAKVPDPDDPPPKWLTLLDDLTPLRALLLGAGFILIAVKLWVFTLGALSVIGEAQAGQSESIIAFLAYIFLAQSLLIIPILIRLIAPSKAGKWLSRFGDWMEKNNRPLVVTVSIVFGLLFLYQGLASFL
jgi:hypothetical protein